MPGLNGTGPMGMGPMTGGARGLCDTGRQFFGRAVNRRGGFVTGIGRCRGYRNRFAGFSGQYGFAPVETGGYPVSYSKENELDFLKNQAAAIKSELDIINARIRSLQPDEAKTA